MTETFIYKKNVLVIGSGGREHAICKALYKSKQLNELHCYGTHYNPGILKLTNHIQIGSLNNTHSIISYARDNNIHFVIIGPEKPLENNLATGLYLNNISCIGPIASYARIETEKAFAREILDIIHPEANPIYKHFSLDNSQSQECLQSSILEYIEKLNDNIVIKANGLKGGKGVKVSGDHFKTREEGLVYINQLIKANEGFVIEEKLVGREFSLMSFSDGTNLSHMPIIRDFKRAYEGDNGPNTGSMGSISYNNHSQPFLTVEDVEKCKKINYDVVNYLKTYYSNHPFAKKHFYTGILYGSFMKTNNGEIKVIEFNARFGDPESINVLALLKTDFIDICKAIINGTLDKLDIEYEEKYTVCRYLVPYGYPLNPIKNKTIYLDKTCFAPTECSGSLDYIASSIESYSNELLSNSDLKPWSKYESVRTLGSRAIALIGKGNTMKEAREHVIQGEHGILGPLFMRKDIGYDDTSDIYKHRSKYAESGVNIDEGNKFVEQIKAYAHSTFDKNVVSKIGDFGGIYNISNMINSQGLTGELCLIASTDGVGTKSVFIEDYFGKEGYNILGRDIVNHCINDILVQGGRPLFFLDYFASSKLNNEIALEFIKGISFSCNKYCCGLIGGETAEMPDVYKDNRCDLAGTIIGVVEKDKIIYSKQTIKSGDIVIALKSSGPHTNGYSLIRKILNSLGTPEENKYKYPEIISKLGEPHRCYLNDYNHMIKNNIKINGLCHITGGGLIENTKRVMQDHLYIEYVGIKHKDTQKTINAMYNYPPEFQFLKDKGNIEDDEMIKVFNCGIGMLIFLNDTRKHLEVPKLLNKLHEEDDYAQLIGFVNSKV